MRHEWGGLTKESTAKGHRLPGSMWVVFKCEVRTTASSLQPWIAQVFAVNGGMSIPLIFAENMLNKPEPVTTNRQV